MKGPNQTLQSVLIRAVKSLGKNKQAHKNQTKTKQNKSHKQTNKHYKHTQKKQTSKQKNPKPAYNVFIWFGGLHCSYISYFMIF